MSKKATLTPRFFTPVQENPFESIVIAQLRVDISGSAGAPLNYCQFFTFSLKKSSFLFTLDWQNTIDVSRNKDSNREHWIITSTMTMSRDFFATSFHNLTSSFSSNPLSFAFNWYCPYNNYLFFILLSFCGATMWIPCANGITNLADVECGKDPYASVGNPRPSLPSLANPLSLLLLRHDSDHYRTPVFHRRYSPSDTNSVDISPFSNSRKGRIINGENAIYGEAPWVVSIKFRTSNNHFCGGTIISKRYVVSAAHCFRGVLRGFFSVNMIKVTVGEYNQSAPEWPVDAVDVGIENIIFHQNFKLRGYVNDIALLRLERDLEWGPRVWPACISDLDDDFPHHNEKEGPDMMKATVFGWGQALHSHDGTNYFPEVLQKVAVPILSNTECAKWFQRQNFKWSPGDGHLCAGYGMKDSCQGDSGGPLMVRYVKGKQPILAGIVAAGSGCGKPGFPGIYTRVAEYVDWIVSNMYV